MKWERSCLATTVCVCVSVSVLDGGCADELGSSDAANEREELLHLGHRLLLGRQQRDLRKRRLEQRCGSEVHSKG